MKKLSLVAAAMSALALAACGTPQPAECAEYMECVAAVDETAGTSQAERDEVSYGAAGSCWNSTAQTAESCTQACIDGVEALAQSYPDECGSADEE